jgi:hypothetical protein
VKERPKSVVFYLGIGETIRDDFHARNVSRDSLLFERILKRELSQDGKRVLFGELFHRLPNASIFSFIGKDRIWWKLLRQKTTVLVNLPGCKNSSLSESIEPLLRGILLSASLTLASIC